MEKAKQLEKIQTEYDLFEVDGDMLLTAQWFERPLYTVMFNTAGGTGNIPSCTARYFDNITLPLDTPTREHDVFVCWRDESFNEYLPGSTLEFDSFDLDSSNTLTLTAVWEVFLNFDLNGGEGEFTAPTNIEGFGVEIPSQTPRKEGYVFLYWQNKNGVTFEPGGWYMLYNGTETLTAVWKEIFQYTLIFDLEEGTGDFPPITEDVTSAITLPSHMPTKEGFHFVWWWGDNDETFFYPGEEYCYNYDYINSDKDTFVLTAQWAPGSMYTITFNLDGGNYYADFEYCLEEDCIYIGIPEKTGHRFLGWLDESGIMHPSGEYYAESDAVLTACWERFAYVISYEEASYELVNVGDSYVITTSVPAKEGYDFIGFTCNGVDYSAGQEIIPTDNMTFQKYIQLKPTKSRDLQVDQIQT